MEKSYEIESLAERIAAYADSYYEGNPEISDEAFDLLVEQLRRMDPENPVLGKVGWGYKVEIDMNATKPHRFEVAKFEDKIRDASKLQIKKGEGLITPKLDGGSVCCYYTNGVLDYAITRGDGENGFDVTPKLRLLAPERLVDRSFSGMVRGEITIDEKVFEERYSKDYDSNRNLAIGLLRRKESTVDEVKTLSFVAYTVRGTADPAIDCKSKVFNWLKINGFDCVDVLPSPESWDDESFRELILGYREMKRFPIDGIVITSENYKELPDGSFVPVCEMAYKTAAESEVVEVKDIEWNLTRTGRMVPVVEIEPTFLSGAWVSRATAFNAKFIDETKMGPGSQIRIQRSGEVIPNIVEVLTEGEDNLPKTCPVCGKRLEWVGTDLKCANPECGDKEFSRMKNWIDVIATPKGLGGVAKSELFEGMGIESIDSLYEKAGDIKDWARENATDNRARLYSEMSDMLLGDIPAAKFFEGCMIPGCGGEGAKALARETETIFLAPDTPATRDKIMGIKGAQQKSKEWVASHLDDIRRWAGYPHRVAPQQESDDKVSMGKQKLIAVTGKLSTTRSKFFEEMARYGYAQGSMANAAYLVTNNPDSNSGKMKDARKRGTVVISESDFRELVGAPLN